MSLASFFCMFMTCTSPAKQSNSESVILPPPKKILPSIRIPLDNNTRTWHLLTATKPTSTKVYISPIAQAIRDAWHVAIDMDLILSPYYQQLRFDEAIDIIHHHQHPSICHDQYYMLSSSYDTGFASEFHISGYGLGLAMEMDRVYIASRWHDPKRAWQVPPILCDDRSNSIFCYYEPWSNCTLSDVDSSKMMHAAAGHRHKAISRSVYAKSSSLLYDASIHNTSDRLVTLHLSSRPINQYLIPKQLQHIVDSLPIPAEFHYYWWRTVSMAYLSRLKPETQSLMQKLRIHGVSALQGNCVSVYVRHGDKEREMQLHSFAEYAYAILNTTSNPTGFSATTTLLLGTETPAIYQEAMKWTRARGWRLLFNQIQLDAFLVRAALHPAPHLINNNSTSSLSLSINSLMISSLSSNNNTLSTSLPHHHHGGGHVIYEYPSMIAYLADFMSCDRFVCTLASNYCRMLDELRVFVTGKLAAPFIDLSGETCRSPPCGIKPSSIKDFKSFSW